MRRRRSAGLWRTVSIAALVSTLLLVCGFGYAVKDMLWPKGEAYNGEGQAEEPEKAGPSASGEIRITAIGDSLTKGTGDATGEGYVKQVIALLGKQLAVPVKLNNNLAVNGMLADQLLDKLSNDKGYKLSLSQANVILFTIGGNDLFQLATGESASEATGEFDLDKLRAELPQGIARLKQVLERLNAINPDARIIYTGLYNPFYDLPDLREGSLEIRKWNDEAYDLIHQYPNMTLIPTYDLFENTIGRYISSDHFHPNHDGYAQIADRIVQSLE